MWDTVLLKYAGKLDWRSKEGGRGHTGFKGLEKEIS